MRTLLRHDERATGSHQPHMAGTGCQVDIGQDTAGFIHQDHAIRPTDRHHSGARVDDHALRPRPTGLTVPVGTATNPGESPARQPEPFGRGIAREGLQAVRPQPVPSRIAATIPKASARLDEVVFRGAMLAAALGRLRLGA